MRRVIAAVCAVVVLLIVFLTRERPGDAPQAMRTPVAQATFVGAAECVSCHPLEAQRWRSSMHARSMQLPSAASVAAPFAGERFSLRGLTTTFARRDGKYVVRTDGPDGALHDFDIAYTFGVYPLQQYLIALPGGRLQALGIAWDARPAPAGQRWYHLYPDTRLRPGNPLHWTSRSQNWNFMCADCHSTNVRKNYVAADDRYETSWTDLNVACEACHGAGSRHLAWARRRGSGVARAAGEDDGLTPVHGFDGASWVMSPATGIAHRDRPRTSHDEIEMCARCHSRRAQLTDDVHVGEPLANRFRPALLDGDLYFDDGQIKGEVYEYGSFLQSRMYANGVTCSDCHEPHKPEIDSSPDNLCRRCHEPETFATPAHHHHAEGSPGSSCVSCHMPARTYMTIDERRDHSFRVPRPDLTVKIGTPNACAACHADRPAQWAADRVREWFSMVRTSQPHYGEAISAARSGAADADSRLLAVIVNPATPSIVKATAITLIRSVDGRTGPALQRSVFDADPLVRMAGIETLSSLPATLRDRLLTPLLSDPARAVRIEAARALDRDTDEWEAAQRFNADTAAAHVNLGALYADRGEPQRARSEYEAALRLEPYFAPAAVNLADLDRAQGNDEAGERVLRDALARTPDAAMLHRALGLLLVRRRSLDAAVVEFRRAVMLAPDDPALRQTLALALETARAASSRERR